MFQVKMGAGRLVFQVCTCRGIGKEEHMVSLKLYTKLCLGRPGPYRYIFLLLVLLLK